jgi:hypothetical protein
MDNSDKNMNNHVLVVAEGKIEDVDAQHASHASLSFLTLE